MSGYLAYLEQIQTLLEKAKEQAETSITQAAELIAGRIASGGVLYVFGPSHAGLMAQDLFYRAGGLLPVEPILPNELMLNVHPVTRTTQMERLSGYAEILLQEKDLQPGDVLLIVSVSGRNPVVTEMCTAAQKRGTRVIALTNKTYAQSVGPRGAAGRLFELADIVIDLPGVAGDAMIKLDGLEQRVGPSSTSVGTAILQGLMVAVTERLLARGVQPPILISANLDHGDSANEKLFVTYRNRLTYL